MGKALKRHILECARGAMPQLKNMGVLVEGRDGANRLVVETPAIGCAHQLIDFAVGQIDAKRAIDESCALSVGDFCQGEDAFQAELGERFRDEKAASFCESFYHGFGKGDRSRTPSARVDIAIGSHESVFREG